LKSKEIQIDDQRRDNENLKNAHTKELDHNYHLQSDLDHIHLQIDAVQDNNSEILDQLERFSQEDEAVRQTLNRKNKVKELKLKSESALKHNVLQLAQSSPNKKLKASFRSSPERQRSQNNYK